MNAFRFAGLLLVALTLWVGAAPLAAQTFPALNNSPVVDQADLLDPQTEAALELKLREFEQRNQRQFVVATVNSLEGYEISDYGYRLGREWALGDGENDDGIILLVAPNERKVRIEVGYGLEGIIPDGLAYEYVERDILPAFKQDDFQGGIVAGADRVITQLQLPPEEAAQVAQAAQAERSGEGGFPIGGLVWLAFIFFFFILPMLRGGRRRRYRRGGMGGAVGDIILWEAGKAIARGMSDGGGGGFGGGGFGGGGGGFGGFSGGGGSFGGGGASGGW